MSTRSCGVVLSRWRTHVVIPDSGTDGGLLRSSTARVERQLDVRLVAECAGGTPDHQSGATVVSGRRWIVSGVFVGALLTLSLSQSVASPLRAWQLEKHHGRSPGASAYRPLLGVTCAPCMSELPKDGDRSRSPGPASTSCLSQRTPNLSIRPPSMRQSHEPASAQARTGSSPTAFSSASGSRSARGGAASCHTP